MQQSDSRFEIKKWNPVAFWSWNIQVETCAICKNHLMEKCIGCESNTEVNDCLQAWGQCKHAYHLHCIEQWLKNKQTCPLDNKNWEYATQQV